MFKQPFSKQDLYKLFAVCAFPIHLWTILMWFQQVTQIYKRTNLWDAFGVGAYEMTYALFETAVIFAVVWVISLILPKRLKGENLLAQMSVSVLVVSLWAIADAVILIYALSIPNVIWKIGGTLLFLTLIVFGIFFKSFKMVSLIRLSVSTIT